MSAPRKLSREEVAELLAGEPGAEECGLLIDGGFHTRWFPALGGKLVGQAGEGMHFGSPEEATEMARRIKNRERPSRLNPAEVIAFEPLSSDEERRLERRFWRSV